MATTRPIAVTVVAIMALASGVIATIRAILDLVMFNTFPGTVGLIVGILTLGVSAGLFARSRIARIIATVVLLLQVASAILTISSTGFDSAEVVLPLAAAALALAAVVLLYTPRANAFFH